MAEFQLVDQENADAALDCAVKNEETSPALSYKRPFLLPPELGAEDGAAAEDEEAGAVVEVFAGAGVEVTTGAAEEVVTGAAGAACFSAGAFTGAGAGVEADAGAPSVTVLVT